MTEIPKSLEEYSDNAHAFNSKPEQNKTMARVQKLEAILDVALTGSIKVFKGQEFVTVETMSREKQIDLFVPKNTAHLETGRPAQIISGSCLFGGNWGLLGETENGSLISLTSQTNLNEAILANNSIKKVLTDTAIHPAELENVYRLVEGLSFFAQACKSPSVKVYFHIPEYEYVLYALDLVHNGLLSPDSFLQIVEAIQNKSDKIRGIYTKKIPNYINVLFISPLSVSNDLIEVGISGGFSPGDLLGYINNDVFRTIKKFGWEPKSFSDIAMMSYAAGYWEHYLLATESHSNALAIETVEEVKIFSQAKAISPSFGRDLGIYPIYLPPKVTTQGGKDLYWIDKPDSLLSVLKYISEASK